MEDVPLYNASLIKNYIEYLRKFYPQIDPNDILEYAGIDSSEIEESGQWLTQRQVDHFHEMLSQIIDNPIFPGRWADLLLVPVPWGLSEDIF